MVEEKNTKGGEGEFPDPKGLQKWLHDEIAEVMKASELRIKEATGFVNAYALGEITREQAEQKCYEYSERWGEALNGVWSIRGQSDEQILDKIKATQEERRERTRTEFAKGRGSPRSNSR